MSENTSAGKKDFVTGTDQVSTTSSADNIAPPVNMPEKPSSVPEDKTLSQSTKDIAARAAFYLQHYGVMAGAFVLGTAITFVIIKKVIRARKK